MRMRKITALCIVLCLSLNLAACGDKNDAEAAIKKAAETAQNSADALKETAENAVETAEDALDTAQKTAEGALDTAQKTAEGALDTAQKTAEGALDTAQKTADTVKDTAVSVKDAAYSWYQKMDFQKFKEGWDYSVDFLGGQYAAAVDGKYAEEVAKTIDSLKTGAGSAVSAAEDLAKQAKKASDDWAGYFDLADYGSPPSLNAQAEARDIIRAYNEYILKEKTSETLKDFMDENGDALKTEALYDSLYKKSGEKPGEDQDMPLSELIGAKYVLNQAMAAEGGQKKLLSTVIDIGPDIYSIIKEAALQSGMDEEALKEAGVEGAIAGSGGFVEGSVSRMLVSLCESGAFGEEMVEVGAPVIGTLTVLTIKGAINGCALAKGEITAEDYGNLMADDVMISLMSLPNPALLLAVLPASKIVMLAGCMAGGIVAGAGFLLAKDAVLNLVDGGGFEAIIPADSTDKQGIAGELVASLGLKEKLSGLKDIAVSTAQNGMITVSPADR